MATSDAEEPDAQSEIVQEIAYLTSDMETTCGICHAEFLDSEDLNVHVKQVHEVITASSNICQFCDVTYSDLDDYARHIRDSHLVDLRCCHVCTKAFSDFRKAKKHERKHFGKNNRKLYSCSQCTGLFTTLKEVELHEMHNHDNKLDGVFLNCMLHLSAALNLKALTLLQSDDQVLICRKCQFTSFDMTAYIDHLKNGNCSIYVCHNCGDVFKTRKSMAKHWKRKMQCLGLTEYPSELTTCPGCKSQVLGKHMKMHLKACRIYKCYACDIVFNTIDELSRHQSAMHPLELDVTKCKYCYKEFAGADAVEKHVERTHKPVFHQYKYACKELGCEAIFKHPQNLFGHYFSTHKELYPYTCKICDKTFRIRKQFTIHIKLEHKSAGFVEFDEQYHVFFVEKKSENPFIPTCVVPELLPVERKEGTGPSKYEKSHKSGIKKTKLQASKDEDTAESAAESMEVINTDNENEIVIETEREESHTDTKKKKKNKPKKKEVVPISSSDDEEAEPLLIIKKRAERRKFQQRYKPKIKSFKHSMTKHRKFTCSVCQKYCYTYQNYHNHMKSHKKNESMECIKCSRSFSTKRQLKEHISAKHTTSKLIETLKSVLERKQGETYNQHVTNIESNPDEELAPSQKFLKTIKKVKVDKVSVSAKITPAPNNLSVKKFIENFVPEVNESKEEANTEPTVTMKRVNNPFYRKETIQLTRFNPEESKEYTGLKMPEKFKEQNGERIKVSVRIVQQPLKQSMFESTSENIESYDNMDNGDSTQDYDDYDDCKNDTIPEVAQEVMLEGTEEPPKPRMGQGPRKIVIPKLPKGYKNIHIATLQTQAPYFKIIKVKGENDEPIIIDTSCKSESENVEEEASENDEVIRLPDGTKFVTANPLAHLMGDTPIDRVLEPTKKKHYYKPAITNFKGLLAEALQNLDKPPVRVKKPKKKTVESAP